MLNGDEKVVEKNLHGRDATWRGPSKSVGLR